MNVFSKYLLITENYSNEIKISKNTNAIKKNRIKKFRMQEEFGPKKFIKPWRTGTKSQQQIPPRGQKKGFRG